VTRAAVQRAAELARLEPEFLGRFPGQLSGGQQQRAAIARALIAEPRLLILDEPFSALDEATTDELLLLIDDIRMERGMGILLITHDLDLVAGSADRVASMDRGRLTEG